MSVPSEACSCPRSGLGEVFAGTKTEGNSSCSRTPEAPRMGPILGKTLGTTRTEVSLSTHPASPHAAEVLGGGHVNLS